jgi:probable F420-dependent oxidoreductase
MAMNRYLSGLDSASEPVPASGRVLAALGPKMLALARSRAAGAHPYLVTVRQVAEARQILGPDAVLAPELTVVVDKDPARARQAARNFLARYLAMRNYAASLARDGFTQDDFHAGGSDRLVDGLVAAGPAESIAARITAFTKPARITWRCRQ